LNSTRNLQVRILQALIVTAISVSALAQSQPPQCQEPPCAPPPPAAPQITTNSLPDGTVNNPYLAVLQGTGQGDLEWRIAAGTLPPGLTMSTTGRITGIPTRAGTYPFTVEMQDALVRSVRKALEIVILPPVVIVNPCPLPDAFLGTPYRQTITAMGGRPPYTFAILLGRLPPGLGLAPDGVLSGTATATGLFEFVIQAVDRDMAQDRKACGMTVPGALQTDPSALEFQATSGTGARSQVISVTSDGPGQAVNVRANMLSGEGWLRATPSSGRTPFVVQVTADASNLAANLYAGSIVIGPPDRTVPVRFQVDPPAGVSLLPTPAAFYVSIPRGAARLARTLVLANRAGRALDVSGLAEMLNGDGWLPSIPLSGRVAAGGDLRFIVQFSPERLAPGVYRGRLRFQVSGGITPSELIVPIVLAVSGSERLLQLSQDGMSFRALAGGRGVPTQSFHVLAAGNGPINWSASASVDAGLPNWLGISRTSGTSSPGNPVGVDVQINTEGLSPGSYVGEVRVQAPGVDNSPRLLLVSLTILAASARPDLTALPAGLVFVGAAGQANPVPAQQVLVRNQGSSAFRLESQLQLDARIWNVTTPADPSIAPGAAAQLAVAPVITGLAAGIYRSTLTLRAAGDTRVRTVDLLLILTGAPPRTAASETPPRHVEITCPPGGLQVSSLRQAVGFNAITGAPMAVEARVIGNDGRPLTAGEVTASLLGATDRIASLSHIDGDPGRWSGTLLPQAQSSGALSMRLLASDAARAASGCLELSGSVQGAASPAIAEGGILSAASFQRGAPAAPGSMVAIFGSGLADGATSAMEFPLPALLGGARVSVAGRTAPLIFAGQSQVNGLLPYGLAPNVSHQVVLRRGGQFGLSELVVTAGLPGIFTVNQSGSGQAIVVHAANPLLIADAQNPIGRGEAIVIYCEGLGDVDPVIESGQQTPVSPLRRVVAPVSVTIGGQEASVVFAGLTPGLAGLYQINAVTPPGIAPGDAVPLVVAVGGQSGPTVTIAVK
jgi:uncharacterized protein (TIGR03437 family)